MHEDEITLSNACTDLVTLRKFEAFPLHLLGAKQPAEWVGVRDFCDRNSFDLGDLKSGLFATWLPDPMANDGYAVILFYDDESKWSMTAHYNRSRLLDDVPANQAPQASGAVKLTSSCSTPKQAAPAAEI